MAAAKSKLQKATTPKQPERKSGFEPDGSLVSVGENGAPGTPDGLMPGAVGASYVTDDPKDPEVDDTLTPEELSSRGYPNPEETPVEAMSSTRKWTNQVDDRMRDAHVALDNTLHNINDSYDKREKMNQEDREGLDYASIPNAPKGDVIVLGPDEPLRVSGEENGNTIVLDKAVYRAKKPFRSLRWTFLLEYPKGAVLPSSKVRTVPVPTAKGPTSTEETKSVSDGDNGEEK